MRLRTLLMSFLALIFAGSSAIGVYLIGGSNPSSSESEIVSVVAAKIDIPRGATITADQVHIVQWPKEFVPEGAILNLEDAVDRAVAVPLVKDEVIRESKVAAKGAGRGMAALVPPGMRAMTILTPNVSTGVAGFVLPGNRVDVLLTLNRLEPNDRTGGAGTMTLLQNVEILAVDQRIEVPSENWIDPKELRSVTLLVSPHQAAQLDLGQNKGTLSLSLRNPEDRDQTEFPPATLARLGKYSTEQDDEADLVLDESLNDPLAVPEISAVVKPPPVGESATEPEESEPRLAKIEPSASPKPPRKPAFLPVRTLRGMAGGVTFQRNLPRPTIDH